jgi:hypothetical protein
MGFGGLGLSESISFEPVGEVGTVNKLGVGVHEQHLGGEPLVLLPKQSNASDPGIEFDGRQA